MAPAKKKKLSPTEQREAQKAAKQKKLLMILAPVLLIAVAIQVPRLLGGDEAAPDETSTAESVEGAEGAEGGAPPPEPGATPADPAAPAGDPLAGDGISLAAPTAASLSEVADSDPLAEVDNTELVSFSTFRGSDPFVQLVEGPSEEEEAEAAEEAADPGSDPGGGDLGDPGVIEAFAILEINGEQEVVQVGQTFPADDPAFRLVSVQGLASISFGLVEGSFSSGIDTLDLEAGRSITLVSQPDGFRYTIRLVQLATDAGAIEGLPASPDEEQ